VELLKLGSNSTTVFTSSAMKGPATAEMYEASAFKGTPFFTSHPPPWVVKDDTSPLKGYQTTNYGVPLQAKTDLGDAISGPVDSTGFARGFSPPYYDHLSPQMGMAVDQRSIFVLGGIPLSLRQYARKPGSDGKHALQSTLIERLCLPNCVSIPTLDFDLAPPCKYGAFRDDTAAAANKDVRTDWAGFKQKHSAFHPPLKWNDKGMPSVSLTDFVWRGPSKDPRSLYNGAWWENEVQVNAGGALAMHLNKDGIATRVYGVTHCGTVFMAEPQKKTVRILLHLDYPGDGHNFKHFRREVGLALQTYDVPDGDKTRTISKLFISVAAKPFFMRFNGFVPAKSGAISRIVKVSVDNLLKCKTFTNQKPTEAKWGVKLYPLEETWFPVNYPNPSFDKHTKGKEWPKYVKLMGVATSGQNVHYANGQLIWYARGSMELKSWSLDIGLPCTSLQNALADALKGWCSKPGICKQRFPGHINVMEDGTRLPWEVVAYRKTETRVTKTSLCSRPARPTTRHSPEQCCVSKFTNPGHEGAPGLADEIKML
jgi:hypothetical protein